MEQEGVESKKRCRKPVNRLVSEIQTEQRKKPAPKKVCDDDVHMTEAEIAATLDFQEGEEVFLKGRINENSGFKGEMLSINKIDEKGMYTLAMANPCHGIWGTSIIRPASKMKKLARRIEFKGEIMPALIPIQFTLESAVFDNRRIATKHAAGGVDPDIFVKEALDGWGIAESWSEDVWTIQAELLEEIWKSHKINYSIFFLLLKDVLSKNFTPKTDNNVDAFFILPPQGGTIHFLEAYVKACEQKQEKYTMSFEYVWIFMDRKVNKKKERD